MRRRSAAMEARRDQLARLRLWLWRVWYVYIRIVRLVTSIVFTAALVALTILFINVHGFELSGTAAITRADDPFWNVRTVDNALSRHDGDRLASFICAINQLIMDDIAGPRLR